MKMKIKVPVFWEMTAEIEVEVEGETKEECIEKAIEEVEHPDTALPEDGDYVDGSFNINREIADIINEVDKVIADINEETEVS